MDDDLLSYYESELLFLRQMGAEFATQYPKIAGRLLLDAEECADPHVERLIEACAFLTSRIRHKLDDDFPELTDALLGILYPHYLTPIPSLSIIQFVLNPGQSQQLTSGYPIERGTKLDSQPINGKSCSFQTCYPVTLWPVDVVDAGFVAPDQFASSPDAGAILRLQLRCLGGTTFAEFALDAESAFDHLRFYLQGGGQLAYSLYELLFNDNVQQVQLHTVEQRRTPRAIALSAECLRPVGFGPAEGLLPYSPRSFLGYRLLQEYFALPEKYLFFDLYGVDQAVRAGFGEEMEVLIFLKQRPRFGRTVEAKTFCLGCTPIINLFQQRAEQILLNRLETEYLVIPDVRFPDAMEVYAIDAVTSLSSNLQDAIHFEPFYSLRHEASRQPNRAFWYATRRPSLQRDDKGTDVYLSFVDLNFQHQRPTGERLDIQTTCTNRDLVEKLPFGGGTGDFWSDFMLEESAPVLRIRCLKKPSKTIRPPLQQRALWRLISHLSLNYLSLCEGGRDALREILRLYDFSGSLETQQQIDGVTQVKSRQMVGRLASAGWNGICRGLEVTIEFDETKYVGSGVFLFASVLEKFLSLYVSLNSFVKLIATTQQREEPLKRWPSRPGEQILL